MKANGNILIEPAGQFAPYLFFNDYTRAANYTHNHTYTRTRAHLSLTHFTLTHLTLTHKHTDTHTHTHTLPIIRLSHIGSNRCL